MISSSGLRQRRSTATTRNATSTYQSKRTPQKSKFGFMSFFLGVSIIINVLLCYSFYFTQSPPPQPEAAPQQAFPAQIHPEENFHTVVSSGCSAYQNWQVEVLLYSWYSIGQNGSFTRIVSGCKDDAQRIRAMKTAVNSDRISYFFTPDFAPPEDFESHGKFFFFNKPYGVKLWFETTQVKEDVIMLIDPDMIMMKKFTNHIAGDEFEVTEGHPAGATYGIGDKWIHWGMCEENDCKIDSAGAWKYYSVGPPYIMHRKDWQKLVQRWAYYSPGALKKDPPPSVLAEMYSFSIAAAEMNLRFKLTRNFFLSSMDHQEPWSLINWNLQEFGPHILHYCQSYWIGKSNEESSPKRDGFNFHKGHVPRHILERCDMPLLKPLENFYSVEEAKTKDPDENKGNTYMLHWVYKKINEAISNYKKTFCPGWKEEYKIVLQQPAPWNGNDMWYWEGTKMSGNNPGAAKQLND